MKKKKIITVFLLVLAGVFTTACKKDTISTNVPNSNSIVINNSSWTTLCYGLGSWNIPCNVKTEYVYFEGDSIIENIAYKKVFLCDDELHKNIKYQGLIREQEKKTYFIPVNSDTEYLLYDFSLEAGMTFEYWDFRAQASVILYVSSVDLVEINGSAKKRIQIKEGSDNGRVIDTWIEETGSMYGILYPCILHFLSGGVKTLLCHYQNDELIYKNFTYSGCYYDKPEELLPFIQQPNIGVSVIPNPVQPGAQLTISSPNEIILSVKLVDILADEIIFNNDDVNSNSFSVDVSTFLNGFYGLSVWLKNGQGGDFIVYKL